MKLAAITAALAGTLAIAIVTTHTPQNQWVVDWTETGGDKTSGHLQHLAHCVSTSDRTLWREVEITADEDNSDLYGKGKPCPPIGSTHKLLDAGQTS